VAHSDIAPDRKEDPGELFDWPGLAAAGIGLWPDFSSMPTGIADAAGLRADLAFIGYPVPPESAGPEAFATVLRAFQRHWRPSVVTGLADAETAGRIAILARAVTA